jgi:Zn-dependent alcohol dehydrogenase
MKNRAVGAREPKRPLVNPDNVGSGKVVSAIVDLTDGGGDNSFECIGDLRTNPLDRINAAFDLMHDGKSIRSVVKF